MLNAADPLKITFDAWFVVALAPVLTEFFALAEPGNAVFARATSFFNHGFP